MFKVPEEFRQRDYPSLPSSALDGNNGVFIFGHKGYEIFCIASDGGGWEHVSVHINRSRTPAWEQMCVVKDMFWDEEDLVMQFHPPKSEYINNHPYVLHLWRPVGVSIPLPPSIMVGLKPEQIEKLRRGIILI